MAVARIEEVTGFWREAGPELWFAKDEAFDAAIRQRFLETHHAAARRELGAWEDSAEGAYALLLALDQFPRNIFRNSAHAYAADGLARAVARRALAAGHDKSMDDLDRPFFYLPFTHSEDLADQELCVALMQAGGSEKNLRFAILHRDIIRDFGRFPHRNGPLGRDTTPQEAAFLAEGGFAG